MGNRGESPPPGVKRGLAPDRIFHLGGRAHRRTLKLLAVLFPQLREGPWVSERAEAKENRKIPWNALLSRRMLAHELFRGNETRGKNSKFLGGPTKLSRFGTVKVVPGEDKFARTSTRGFLASQFHRLLVIGVTRVSAA